MYHNHHVYSNDVYRVGGQIRGAILFGESAFLTFSSKKKSKVEGCVVLHSDSRFVFTFCLP